MASFGIGFRHPCGGTLVEQATFAAGCFWGIQYAFQQLEGVQSTEVGYTGGTVDHPTYKDVCSGTTGHAEAVRVEFDPARIGFTDLLDVFWQIHDPTTLNRQGADVGHQYRSAVFTHSPEQQAAAESSRKNVAGQFSDPIVTEILPASEFHRAEEYHQNYVEKNGEAACPVPSFTTKNG